MQFSKWHNCPKTTQMLHKNKACDRGIFSKLWRSMPKGQDIIIIIASLLRNLSLYFLYDLNMPHFFFLPGPVSWNAFIRTYIGITQTQLYTVKPLWVEHMRLDALKHLEFAGQRFCGTDSSNIILFCPCVCGMKKKTLPRNTTKKHHHVSP